MNSRLTLFITCCLIIASCRQPEKAKEVMKQAMDVYLFAGLDDSIKVDSSLVLTNKALDFDDYNIQALNHKATLLFRKRNIDGLLRTADELIKLKPEKPFYLGQKAFYFELKAFYSAANEYYNKAISKYEEYLQNDSLDFDLMMEYVGILEASGDTTLANGTMAKMKNMEFEDFQKKMLDLYKKQSVSKEQLTKYWTGEIGYDQIGKK